MNRPSPLAFAILPLLLLAAGCGNPNSEKLAKLTLNYFSGMKEKVPRERAAEIPYATMGLEFGLGPQVLLVLGTTEGDALDWYAGETIFVRTVHGRVMRTAGFPADLGGRQVAVIAGTGQSQGVAAYSLDFPDLGIFGAVAQCTTTNAGMETVEILGSGIATRHVVEHCAVSSMRWNFDNDFWEDPMTGYAWRSRQFIHPKSPPLVLEVFRPETSGPG